MRRFCLPRYVLAVRKIYCPTISMINTLFFNCHQTDYAQMRSGQLRFLYRWLWFTRRTWNNRAIISTRKLFALKISITSSTQYTQSASSAHVFIVTISEFSGFDHLYGGVTCFLVKIYFTVQRLAPRRTIDLQSWPSFIGCTPTYKWVPMDNFHFIIYICALPWTFPKLHHAVT